ncbi:MAG: NAD(+) diphosphatase [Opitutus sp.]
MTSFVHLHAAAANPTLSDTCLVVHGDRLLAHARETEGVIFPTFDVVATWSEPVRQRMHVGLIAGRPHWALAVERADAPPPAGWQWQETRALLSLFTPDQWQAISCARQLLWWDRRHQFCGACGTPTVEVSEERARRCPKCTAMFFPVVSSAVIVAVTRGEELLLAHNRNFRAGMFSLLAGFVDPGETLEQAAIREVREEVGIQIKNLVYVTSQPWAFPNSLMVGFRAEFASGDILVDGKEIEEARWYRRASLPEIPRPGTVARQIIDLWHQE